MIDMCPLRAPEESQGKVGQKFKNVQNDKQLRLFRPYFKNCESSL